VVLGVIDAPVPGGSLGYRSPRKRTIFLKTVQNDRGSSISRKLSDEPFSK